MLRPLYRRRLLSMLLSRQRILVSAWRRGLTYDGEPVQLTDIEPWLADLPWRVEYDGFTDKFVLTRTH
ncbi:MAG: hypothetical protein ACJ8AD_14745 [Gemmatimonadaceae bacterium]